MDLLSQVTWLAPVEVTVGGHLLTYNSVLIINGKGFTSTGQLKSCDTKLSVTV